MDESTKETLERLRRQLDTLELTDAERQARLNQIRHLLRESLDQPETPPAASLSDLLTEAVVFLDEGNPDITMAIKEAIDSLSRAGI